MQNLLDARPYSSIIADLIRNLLSQGHAFLQEIAGLQ